jgi:hypothetical protein
LPFEGGYFVIVLGCQVTSLQFLLFDIFWSIFAFRWRIPRLYVNTMQLRAINSCKDFITASVMRNHFVKCISEVENCIMMGFTVNTPYQILE